MFPPELAPLLYRELERIVQHDSWNAQTRTLALSALLERVFQEATRQEQLVFSSLFARISYAGHRYHFQPETLHTVHRFRWAARQVKNGRPATDATVALGVRAIAESVLVLTGLALPDSLLPLLAAAEMPPAEAATAGWMRSARVVALEDHPEHNYLIVNEESGGAQPLRVLYGLPDRNEQFMPTIQAIRKVFGFPVVLNLLDVDVDSQGQYRPRAFVVEPDYLMDVSAIAECFQATGADPYSFLVRKFLPYELTEAKFLGNIANYFLDRLLHEPQADWKTVFADTFQLYPLQYAPLTDKEVLDIRQKAQRHFVTLKSMAAGALMQQGIAPEDCVLEPTFFSEQYGLQGRLDLFHQSEERPAIVELKSGTPFKPNSYGIQRSHFTQTLLYDLLVRSVFGHGLDPAKYILYSGADTQPLRFAPTVAPEQWEALQLRNQLVALERLLTRIQPGDVVVPVFGRLRSGKAAGGFTERDFARFEVAYLGLSELEKKYFNAFTGFIAREHWLAKMGDEGNENLPGHATLWRSTLADKELNFSVLSHLELLENRADQPEPSIVFRRTEASNPLANFRIGDIAVLYPALETEETVLQHQVLKCTITELSAERIVVQPRFRQFNLKPFEVPGQWRLEPDLMDIGYTAMYRSLLEWATAPPERRALLLGMAPPAPATEALPQSATVFERWRASQDYFLLWGPPGTGKTSVLLRDMAHHVLHDTDQNLLLLAYTNRAVDEICEALDSIGGAVRQQYLRIGNKHATPERYKPQLLHTKIAGATARAELRTVLDSHRIVVSTVASFGQNEGLLRLKKFHRLVVDEASQILEPQIIALLSRFQHWTLIGDHRQLPAVSTQRQELSAVADADLRSIGLWDLRDSYFERLYRQCQAQQWHWAYGQLSAQGRMHADLMDFPNRYFYDGLLRTLPDDLGLRQHSALAYHLPAVLPDFGEMVTAQRAVFLPCTPDAQVVFNGKTSPTEAARVAELVAFFQNLYRENGKPWDAARSLGIITPWRAQIAQIRAALQAAGIEPELLTIDTVERYQGGARDIIVVSTCVHSVQQLASLVSLGDGGVDRKLNVALTRARDHLILLGNTEVLRQDAHYAAFIAAYGAGVQAPATAAF